MTTFMSSSCCAPLSIPKEKEYTVCAKVYFNLKVYPGFNQNHNNKRVLMAATLSGPKMTLVGCSLITIAVISS